ncbi:MAG TPA: hypothetical protein VF221_21455 [Chloroflexota bacterium]
MENAADSSPMVARCAVCRGNIHADDAFEVWEGGYYCERHSLSHLRERAREYAALLELESRTNVGPESRYSL